MQPFCDCTTLLHLDGQENGVSLALAYVYVCIAVFVERSVLVLSVARLCMASCSASKFLLASEELDAETLKDILSKFAPRMGAKWDFIGIQLREGNLVQELRSSPELGRQKVQRIIDEWLTSENEAVPVRAETMSRVLRSVGLGAVAKVFEKVRWPQCVYEKPCEYCSPLCNKEQFEVCVPV